jgi:ribosomal-protein-alanine N-acetyltransferase
MQERNREKTQLPVSVRMLNPDNPKERSCAWKIERGSFKFTDTRRVFEENLKSRTCYGLVAVHHGRIIGITIYSFHDKDIELHSIAVEIEYQKMGAGSQMLAKLIDVLIKKRGKRIITVVREINLEAQICFRSSGFKATEVIQDFYPPEKTTENCYIMQYFADPREAYFKHKCGGTATVRKIPIFNGKNRISQLLS